MPTHSLEAAQAWRENNLDPARRKGNQEPPTQQQPQNPFEIGAESFDQARTRDKVAEANLREMNAAKRRGELIEVEAVKGALAKFLSEARESLLQIPPRMAPLLAAESDPAALQGLLHIEIHRVLLQLSGAPDEVQKIADGASK